MMRYPKVVVEEHADGFVAYPVGRRGAVVGRGDTCDEALADLTSAIRFHIETSGPDAVDAGVLHPHLAGVTV